MAKNRGAAKGGRAYRVGIAAPAATNRPHPPSLRFGETRAGAYLSGRARLGRRGRVGDRAPTCGIKSMNPECESHLPSADRESVAAGGNCVAAMRGGEQPEAQVRSQIGRPRPVNSIRWLRGASLRRKGEACRASGEPRTAQNLSTLERGPRSHGRSENAPKGPGMTIRDRRGRLSCAGVRAPIVATKPGNAGGAKERRKVNAR